MTSAPAAPAALAVASPDPATTSAAWQRLGVALAVEVVPVPEGEHPGLVEMVLADDDPADRLRLLARRGALVEDEVVDLAGVRWRIAAPTPRAGDGLALDHVVVSATDATRAAADYGARLGLDLRLDREAFGFRGLFFRCGDAVVEVVVAGSEGAAGAQGEGGGRGDAFAGLAWRCPDVAAERDRLVTQGVEVSEVREGRKPGTRVATVRDPDLHVPTLLIGPS